MIRFEHFVLCDGHDVTTYIPGVGFHFHAPAMNHPMFRFVLRFTLTVVLELLHCPRSAQFVVRVWFIRHTCFFVFTSQDLLYHLSPHSQTCFSQVVVCHPHLSSLPTLLPVDFGGYGRNCDQSGLHYHC